MNKICSICNFYVGETVHGIFIYDSNNKDKIELTGHEDCIEQIYQKVKLIQKPLPIAKVIEYLGIEVNQ